jgi:hypothetical protein
MLTPPNPTIDLLTRERRSDFVQWLCRQDVSRRERFTVMLFWESWTGVDLSTLEVEAIMLTVPEQADANS